MEESKPVEKPGRGNRIGRLLFLLLTAVCFVYLYLRLNGAAQREGTKLGCRRFTVDESA